MSRWQLIILGNGFDLHCGLKSDYESFFSDVILDDNTAVKRIKSSISGFWEEFLYLYFEVYGNEKRWCDVESIIKDVISLLVFGKSDKLGKTTSSITYSALLCARNNKDASYEFRRCENPFEKYLICSCEKFFCAHLQENNNYSDNKLNGLLFKDIANELHKFERRFCRYLQNQIETNHFSYELNAFNLLSKIIDDKQPLSSINQILQTKFDIATETYKFTSTLDGKNMLKDNFPYLRPVRILSFNYTSLFDILKVDSPCAYVNVHGKLCNQSCDDNCQRSNIIFGIDDFEMNSLGAGSNVRLFSKTFRKMLDTSSSADILLKNDGRQIDIKFYGHSLNEADYSYFQSIFDYYDIYGSSNIRLIFCYSNGYEQQNAIYQLINEYGETLNNKDQGKNLIHKLLLENRLKIEKID